MVSYYRRKIPASSPTSGLIPNPRQSAPRYYPARAAGIDVSRLLGVLLAVLPWLYHKSLQMQVASIRRTTDGRIVQHRGLARELRWAKEKLKSVRQQSSVLQASNNDVMLSLIRQGDNIDMENAEYEAAEAREEACISRLDEVKESIIAASVRILQQYAGTNKRVVRVQVTIDKRAGQIMDQSFVIEMSPITVAPHAASHFVRMVNARLFDGLSLLHSTTGGSSIIHSAAIDAKTGQFDEARFQKANLTTVAFAEHSPNYPNDKYTGNDIMVKASHFSKSLSEY
jgi:hypothetical protein